jgi:hypothetical protein
MNEQARRLAHCDECGGLREIVSVTRHTKIKQSSVEAWIVMPRFDCDHTAERSPRLVMSERNIEAVRR